MTNGGKVTNTKKWDDTPFSEDHVGYHLKSFEIDGPLPLIIDYDDVPHYEVDILAEEVVKCLNEHFVAPVVVQCRNDDCDEGWSKVTRYNPQEPIACPYCGQDRERFDAGL